MSKTTKGSSTAKPPDQTNATYHVDMGKQTAWVEGLAGTAEVYPYNRTYNGVPTFVVSGDGFLESVIVGFDNAVLRMLEEARKVIRGEKQCTGCGGSGREDILCEGCGGANACEGCLGRGCEICDDTGVCPVCEALGEYMYTICNLCEGEGEI